MNGTDMKKAAINKAKQVAQAANSNGGKKRRKGQDLKPIITSEGQAGAPNASSPSGSTGSFHYKYVHCSLPTAHCPLPPPLPLLLPLPVQAAPQPNPHHVTLPRPVLSCPARPARPALPAALPASPNAHAHANRLRPPPPLHALIFLRARHSLCAAPKHSIHNTRTRPMPHVPCYNARRAASPS